MSKAEIIAELPYLSPAELAEVQAKLDELAAQEVVSKANSEQRAGARVRTPRLADRSQAGDFVKQVTDLPADAPRRHPL